MKKLMEQGKKVMKAGLKMLGTTGLILGFFILMDLLCAKGELTMFTISKAAGIENGYTCKGVINSPDQLEMLSIRESNLKATEKLLNEDPTNENLLAELAKAQEKYDQALQEAEAFKQTEEYENYLKGLECNRMQSELRKR